MKNSERGSVQVWALVAAGILVATAIVLCVRYRNDLKRYQAGPLAVQRGHRSGHPSVTSPQRLAPQRLEPRPLPPVPRYTITGSLSNRPILYKVMPAYPEWAEKEGVYGRVRLAFRVSNTGEVYPAIAVTQTVGHPELDEAAVQALRHWRFAPTEGINTSAPADMYSEPTPGQPGVINFTFSLTNRTIQL